jgi:hypothetical protein
VKEYFYLISSLPDLELDSQKKLPSLTEFLDFCESQLSEKEFLELKKVFIFNDILNAAKSDSRESSPYIYPAFYTREDFLENLKDTDEFFPFLSTYFCNKKLGKRDYPELQEIDELFALFYENLETLSKNRFITDYFRFELDLRNTLTFLNMKKNNMDFKEYLVPFGDSYERLSKTMNVENSLPDIEVLVESVNEGDIIATELTVDNVRWKWLDNEVGNDYFSLKFIIAYAIKLTSVERWHKLTDISGKNMLDKLIDKIKSGIVFSDEFLKSGGKK